MKDKVSNMMRIPFALPYITEDEINKAIEVLKSGWLTMGHKTIEFEDRFAKYIGSKHAVATDSCTSALFLSLKAHRINPGDEVITTTFTFTATANVIVHCKAIPVLADINERTYNIDADRMEEKITSKTKAIIAVHYGGQPADMKNIMEIAKEYDLKVVEDAAHAVGSQYENGKKVGSLGNMTCFSFYATKPMTAGEGGMITLNEDDISEELRMLRLHGMTKGAWKRYLGRNSWYYEVVQAGYKCHPTDMTSAIGIEQLKKLDWMNGRRKEIAEYYNENLKDLDVILPFTDSKLKSTHHLYPIRLIKCNRDKFIKKMAEKGIATSVHFIPLHLMPYYRRTNRYKRGDFPIAEKVYESTVSLPIYPQLKEEEMGYIVKSIREILKK
jgi:dTDP-4-amino-4,6-dideoxygalactose transaminase